MFPGLVAVAVIFALQVAASPVVAADAVAAAPPNILFILADDLNADWKSDRLSYMPNLKKYLAEEGTEFVNHVAAVPVCGPSRSSFIMGRYPHNTGYLTNDDFDSVARFEAIHNESIGKWLRDAGYHTAFLGKYVNSVGSVPSGWSHWGGFINTYDFYNCSGWNMTWSDDPKAPEPEPAVRRETGVHQADFLPRWVEEQMDLAATKNKPFFIHTTPVMPHWGTCYGPDIPESDYAPDDPHFEFTLTDPITGKHVAYPTSPCPSDKNKHAFDGHSNPRIPGVWNRTGTGPQPAYLRQAFYSKPLDSFAAWREDIGFRNRSASLLDLDDMIGSIMSTLARRKLLKSTIVIFSSDNGYHLGEHTMPFGKGQAFETDIRLPMYVRGPGVPVAAKSDLPTTHLDIAASIVDWGAASSFAPMADLDGTSFVASLGNPGTAWRRFSYSEFFTGNNTWQHIRVLSSRDVGTEAGAGLVSANFTLTRWCLGDLEVYNLQEDPWQMHNLINSTGGAGKVAASIVKSELPRLQQLSNCSGSSSCSNPGSTKRPGGSAAAEAGAAFACYQPRTGKRRYQGSWNFNGGAGSEKRPTMIHGFAFDWKVDGWGTGKPRGFGPIEVHLLCDGKPVARALANMTRPDLRGRGFPNIAHGFVFQDLESVLPTSAWTASLTEIDVRGVDGNHPLSSGGPTLRCLCRGLPCACRD